MTKEELILGGDAVNDTDNIASFFEGGWKLLDWRILK
jgi:hypothetical protein